LRGADVGQSALQPGAVEWNQNLALRGDPLTYLEGQAAGDVGSRVRRPEVEGVELSALAQNERVGEALGREEGRAGRSAGDDGVRGGGGPVDGEGSLGERLLEGEPARGCGERQRPRDAGGEPRRCRRRPAPGSSAPC